jgi:hypothetical protein
MSTVNPRPATRPISFPGQSGTTSIATSGATSRPPTRSTRTCTASTVSWSSGLARWQNMALKVFKLPGGEGGLRKPYLMPTDTEVERCTTGLLALGLSEI